MAGPTDAPGRPTLEVQRALRPLERIASFRFAYGAIFLFLVGYVFTVEALEEVLRRYYRAEVEAAVRVDPADGPVAADLDAHQRLLQGRLDPLRRRARAALVLAADGRTLLCGWQLPESDAPVAGLRRPAARNRRPGRLAAA
jgi:hypothetical protein